MPRAANWPSCTNIGKPVRPRALNAPTVLRAAMSPMAHISLEASRPELVRDRSRNNRYAMPWSTVMEMMAPPESEGHDGNGFVKQGENEKSGRRSRDRRKKRRTDR